MKEKIEELLCNDCKKRIKKIFLKIQKEQKINLKNLRLLKINIDYNNEDDDFFEKNKKLLPIIIIKCLNRIFGIFNKEILFYKEKIKLKYNQSLIYLSLNIIEKIYNKDKKINIINNENEKNDNLNFNNNLNKIKIKKLKNKKFNFAKKGQQKILILISIIIIIILLISLGIWEIIYNNKNNYNENYISNKERNLLKIIKKINIGKIETISSTFIQLKKEIKKILKNQNNNLDIEKIDIINIKNNSAYVIPLKNSNFYFNKIKIYYNIIYIESINLNNIINESNNYIGKIIVLKENDDLPNINQIKTCLWKKFDSSLLNLNKIKIKNITKNSAIISGDDSKFYINEVEIFFN